MDNLVGSARERHAIMEDFFDHVFGGLEVDPAFVAGMRPAGPELPEHPTAEQADAWLELVALVTDEGFRAGIRAMSERQGPAGATSGATARRTATLVLRQAGPALSAAVDPSSPAAARIVREIAGPLAAEHGRPDDAAFRAGLADRMERGTDVRAERYWQLVGTINGWPSFPSAVPAFEWAVAALRASAAPVS